MLVSEFLESMEILLRDGVGALLNIMSNTTRLVSSGKGGCAKYSVLGLYLRRVLLSFDKLTFAQVCVLFYNVTVHIASGDIQDYPTLFLRIQKRSIRV